MNSVKRIAGLKCTGQDRASVGQQHLFDYSFARFALLKSSCIRLQVGSTLLVCSLVLTTSRGFVIMPAMAPEKPAQIKYHKRGFWRSQGLIQVFMFSFTVITHEANGMFISTVIG
jgi:hypothetical protein